MRGGDDFVHVEYDGATYGITPPEEPWTVYLHGLWANVLEELRCIAVVLAACT